MSWVQNFTFLGLNFCIAHLCAQFFFLLLMLWAMENWNESAITSSLAYTGGQQLRPIISSHSDCKTESEVVEESEVENTRWLEQPFWVDDLLNELESPLQRSHRSLNQKKQLKSKSSTAAKPIYKHQFARNLHLRKLQYIAELEASFQILKAEESEASAELQYLNQQNLILGMENQVLKQRLDSLSQEQLIKHMEQEMLERELARLHILYQQKQQQQNQQSTSMEVEIV